MDIQSALKKIESYDNKTKDLITFIDNQNFEIQLISKTADFLKENFNIKNIYICQREDSFIVLKNSQCKPSFKINLSSAKKNNLPFTINTISHFPELEHICPLKSSDGIPAACLPIKSLEIDQNHGSWLQIQFKQNQQLTEGETILLSHISSTIQNIFHYHHKFSMLESNFKAADEEYKQFIHFVSHDLKSPITAILGFISIINNENTNDYSDNLKHYLKRISVNATIIDKMINDLLYIARLKKSDMEEINSKELIIESIAPLLSSIKEKNLNLIINNNFPLIFANRNHISTLIRNILKNAIHFTDSRGQIHIGYNGNEFFISDTGFGIKNENIEKSFRIFYTTCEKQDKHIGTGLFIAKKIVALYGKNIRIESQYGKGTTVFFTLPKI